MARTKQAAKSATKVSATVEMVTLAGTPRALRGSIKISNAGTESLVVTGATARGENLPSATAAIGAIVPPGQTQEIFVSLSLPPGTPPGEYAGEIEVAGETRPLTLHVVETSRLRVTPGQIVVDARDGSEVVKRVILSNEGNVAQRIGSLSDIVLEEERVLRQTIRAVLSAVGASTVVVADDSKARQDSPTLRVESKSGDVTLAPGEIRPLELTVHVPDGLEPNVGYRGRAALGASSLEFIVPA